MNTEHLAIEVSKDEHFRTPFLKTLKENWPSMAKDYRHYCHVFGPKQGDLWVWTSPEGQKFFHFIMDEESSHTLQGSEKIHFFKMSLKKMKRVIENEKISHIVFPIEAFKFKDAELVSAHSLVKEVMSGVETEVKFK